MSNSSGKAGRAEPYKGDLMALEAKARRGRGGKIVVAVVELEDSITGAAMEMVVVMLALDLIAIG